MCRHFAYLGPRAPLQQLVFDAPHSLAMQSYAPRRQGHGTVNVDGFGAGWYVDGHRRPVRYRRAQPIWSDQSFASLAPTVESGCVLAAVRSATPGYPADESCAAPFTHEGWLFSHNGCVFDSQALRKTLQDRVSWVPDALAAVDSAFMFGLAVTHWSGGASLGAGLASTVTDVAAAADGRLTTLATDGSLLAGTTWGEPLYVRRTTDAVVLAAEPDDDGADWEEVPDRTLVEADRTGVHLTSL
ncbi:MAG: ergothioneine biosynthesis protein EgtC [Streptosporangiales bacterium]|nr:ergothioneine biosynthesis protein EgtC [Streptosporangiales bacterium]